MLPEQILTSFNLFYCKISRNLELIFAAKRHNKHCANEQIWRYAVHVCVEIVCMFCGTSQTAFPEQFRLWNTFLTFLCFPYPSKITCHSSFRWRPLIASLIGGMFSIGGVLIRVRASVDLREDVMSELHSFSIFDTGSYALFGKTDQGNCDICFHKCWNSKKGQRHYHRILQHVDRFDHGNDVTSAI